MEICHIIKQRLSLVDDESSRTLNLSSHHLTDKTCMILSKLLARDQKFNCLKFNDCSLTKEAIRDICHAMVTNNSVVVLELKVYYLYYFKITFHYENTFANKFKGNNIHDEGTECLAKMLRQNTTIKT